MGSKTTHVTAASFLIFGASRGIGRMLAQALAAQGCTVTAAGRAKQLLRSLQRDCQRQGAALQATVADVTRESSVAAAFRAHRSAWKQGPDVVINCAATQGPIADTWQVTARAFKETMDTNLFGSFLVARAAVRDMLPRRRGTIILFSGGGAAFSRPRFAAYGASKTAVLRLVETIADELRAAGLSGIRIAAIAPGAVKTRMTAAILAAAAAAGKTECTQARAVTASGGTPLEQILDLVRFIADDPRGTAVSGSLVHVREPYRALPRLAKLPDGCGKLRRLPLTEKF
jgi:NAD(P)-dependent dehydrogenase (short-subunit alcohol dehydrogenase family)